MISLTLTYPPSANRLWRNVKGKTLKSGHYRAWLLENRHAGLGLGSIDGPYALHVIATAPDRRARDLDNLPKAINDCLQAIGVVANDSNTKRLTIEWGSAPAPGVSIEITPFKPEQA